MKLGFVSAILADFSLRDVFRTAAEIGYDCVELMCWPAGKAERRYAGVTHVTVDPLTAEQIAELHSLVREYGVQVSGLGYYPNPLAADGAEAAAAVAHLHKLLEACATLEIRTLNTFVGRDPQRSVNEQWPRFLETWRPLVAAAEKHGVRIGIENCPMLFSGDEWPGGKNLAVSPAIWRHMFAEIPSDYIGLNFDPSHCVWQQMDYLTPLREFSAKLFHVHAKDVRLDRHRLNDVGILAHPLEYHVPKLPGLGEVDWGKFISTLGDCGYRGPVCVEVEDRAYEDSSASRRASLVQSHTYLRNFIPQRGASA